jgi:hypothetical protein
VALKLTASLPPDLDLPPNWIVQLVAVDPTTGAAVSGVNVSNVAIIAAVAATDTTGDTGQDYAPLFIPLVEAPGSG